MKKNPCKKNPVRESSRRLNEFNKIILDHIPVSVITIDMEGNITSANKYFKNFSHTKDYKNENIFSSEFFIRENLVEDYRKLLSRGTIVKREDCHEINSKGEDKYLNIIAVPFRDKDGNIAGAISLASDNTEATVFKKKLLDLNNRLEERVEQRTAELHATNDELSKVLELKSIFMADISHEFRTSLTIMQCSLDLLAKACTAEKENAELFDNVITEIKRSSDMLSDLSLLSTSAVSELKLKYETVDLTSSIATICSELEVMAQEKNIKILCERNASPIKITADKEAVGKLLLNLIRNAIKYNKDDGWIRVWVEAGAAGACIKVEDSGIGIPKEEIPHIFERFYRVDKARTRNGEDSGLGLAICKHVAEAHGGTISVVSEPGEGSLFTVCLPYAPQSKNGY